MKELKKANPYKVTSIEKAVKDVDLSKRTVTGVFNSYFLIDSDLDMLMPGCASKSIQERGAGSTKGNRIKHLKDHDWTKNIARIDVLDEREVDIDGKKMQGIYHESFFPDSTDSTDMLIKLQEGLYDSRSIGFKYVNIELIEQNTQDFEKYLSMALNPEKGIEAGYFYVVKEIQLWEGSDVSFGANQLTPMLGVKGQNKELLKNKLFEKVDICNSLLRKGNLTDEGFHHLEMELKQIKSYISTLTEQESQKHTGSPASRIIPSTQSSGFDFIKTLSKKL
jgi:phage head maturation protease